MNNLINISDIELINPFNGKSLYQYSDFLKDDEGMIFPLINGSYRIVSQENYASNFGFQWNTFPKTQIDKFSFQDLSRARFFKTTGWQKEDLNKKNILEVGCGAGRFTQVLLEHSNANIYSVDYSTAVDANFANNGPNERLKLFQASIYDLPFKKESFDKVFCLGVLQHTPDFKKSIESLSQMVKPGGELVVDFYSIKGWWTKLHAKYLFRPWTKKMSEKRLLELINSNVDWMINLSQFFIKTKIDKITNRFIPICDIKNTLPPNLSKEKLKEWVVLDTFDMFSPQYDFPQKIQTVKKLIEEQGLKVSFAGEITYGPGIKAAAVRAKRD